MSSTTNQSPSAHQGIASIDAILNEMRNGRMVIIVDDEDRENEGDFMLPAALVEPHHINFMANYGRGLVCLTITKERSRQLNLPLMVASTDASLSTNFTVSIEAAQGVDTGISASDRAHTVRVATMPHATPADIVMPGHVFPVQAQPGGVLTRAGHTEAGCDLARLAGFEPSSVICEIMREDGEMARLPELLAFGQKHGICIGTIADLIEYRLKLEPTLLKQCDCTLQTHTGVFRLHAFKSSIDGSVHLALTLGDLGGAEPVLTRVHVHRGLVHPLDEARSFSGWSVNDAMRHIAKVGRGVLLLLNHYLDDEDLLTSIRQGIWQEQAQRWSGKDVKASRTIGLGSQILAQLGVGDIIAMGTENRYAALSGFGIRVVQTLEKPHD